jgi:hypothetical protein
MCNIESYCATEWFKSLTCVMGARCHGESKNMSVLALRTLSIMKGCSTRGTGRKETLLIEKGWVEWSTAGSGNQVPPSVGVGGFYIYVRLPHFPKEQFIVESYRSILGMGGPPVPPGPLATLVSLLLPGRGGFCIPKLSRGDLCYGTTTPGQLLVTSTIMLHCHLLWEGFMDLPLSVLSLCPSAR